MNVNECKVAVSSQWASYYKPGKQEKCVEIRKKAQAIR